MRQKGFAHLFLILVIGVVLVGVYALYQRGYIQLHPAINVDMVSPTLIPQPTSKNDLEFNPTTTETDNWKTNKQTKVGFTIKSPSDWIVDVYNDDSLLSHQDYVTSMELAPNGSEDEGTYGDSITIGYPISIHGSHKDVGKKFESGLKGLEFEQDDDSSYFSKYSSVYSEIDEKKVLTTIEVYKTNPPANFAGSWCNCTHKHVYIDLGNGEILDILGYWQNTNPNFEAIFDQIVSTFKFSN